MNKVDAVMLVFALIISIWILFFGGYRIIIQEWWIALILLPMVLWGIKAEGDLISWYLNTDFHKENGVLFKVSKEKEMNKE